jgi:hypothetical protein
LVCGRLAEFVPVQLSGAHDARRAIVVSLLFIIGLSVPLSAALIVMLRRAYSLAPPLTAAMAGLASAAAAATLLNFFHPFDAALADLAVHAVAVLIVVAAAREVGRRTSQNSFARL